MLDYIARLLKELLRALGSALWKFFTEFYEWVFNHFISLIQGALDSMGLDLSLGWATEFWQTLNFFFPVNESLAMLTVVFGYWLTCFLIKVTLKAVPTVY